MKPYAHPKSSDINLEGILYALSDPTRISIYSQIESSKSPLSCCHFCEFDNLPKSTVSKHFKILRESGLIHCEMNGIEMISKVRRDEFGPQFGQMVDAIVTTFRKQQCKKSTGRRLAA